MSILHQAEALINGPRREEYGDVELSFQRVANMWTVIFGHEVTSKQVAQAMIAFKLCREINAHKEDNLVDIAGYLLLLEKLHGTHTNDTPGENLDTDSSEQSAGLLTYSGERIPKA